MYTKKIEQKTTYAPGTGFYMKSIAALAAAGALTFALHTDAKPRAIPMDLNGDGINDLAFLGKNGAIDSVMIRNADDSTTKCRVIKTSNGQAFMSMDGKVTYTPYGDVTYNTNQ